MHDPNVEGDSTLQLVMDQVEELLVTIIEEIRARPGVAAAILAGIVGAVVGSMLAARLARERPPTPKGALRRARRLGDAAELAGLAMRLMQNPIVRGIVFAAVERQLKRRMSF